MKLRSQVIFAQSGLVTAAALLSAALSPSPPAVADHSPEFSLGDVFVSSGSLITEWRHPWDGSLHANIDIPPVLGTPSVVHIDFDPNGNLYHLGENAFHRFDSTGTYLGKWGPAFSGLHEPGFSFDRNGDAYVAQNCNRTNNEQCTQSHWDVLKLDSDGNLIGHFPVDPGNKPLPYHFSNTWEHSSRPRVPDLAPDQCTLYYTDGFVIKRYLLPAPSGAPDPAVCSVKPEGQQLEDFATRFHGRFDALRVTPTGEVLVNDVNHIHLYGRDGKIKRTWDIGVEVPPSCDGPPTANPPLGVANPDGCNRGFGTGPGGTWGHCPRDCNNSWTGLALDPDGTTFWTSDYWAKTIYRFRLGTGADPAGHMVPVSQFKLDRHPLALAVADAIRVGAPPTVGISDAEVTEPATGTKTMNFTVSLSAPLEVPITVTYSTADGPAEAGARSGADFEPVAKGSLTIPAGKVEVGAQVEVLADTDAAESTETFFVNLSENSDIVGNRRPRGTGTIYDYVPALPTKALDDDRGESGADGGQGNGSETSAAPGPDPNVVVPQGGPNLNQAPSPAPGPAPNAPTQPVVQAPGVQAQPIAPAQPIAQPQPVAQVQAQQAVQAQAQQAVQAQPAMMLERQREVQLQTERTDGARDAWLASSRRPSPAPVLGVLGVAMGLGVALAWGAGSVVAARSIAVGQPRRRQRRRQAPRHHREWAQEPW